jgi:hypothetical protein
VYCFGFHPNYWPPSSNRSLAVLGLVFYHLPLAVWPAVEGRQAFLAPQPRRHFEQGEAVVLEAQERAQPS